MSSWIQPNRGCQTDGSDPKRLAAKNAMPLVPFVVRPGAPRSVRVRTLRSQRCPLVPIVAFAHNGPLPFSGVDVLRLAGGPAALLEALLWARDWSTERRSTAPAQARTHLLQQLLALLSCCCRNPIGTDVSNEPTRLPLHQLVLLWTGSFGCLLKAASPAQEKVWRKRHAESGGVMSAEFLVRGELPPALPQARLCEVLQRVAEVQADWPMEVRLLWRVLHSRSTAREVSKLWMAAPYTMQDISSEVESAPVHEMFIPGIIAASGTLSRSLQKCLLCTGCQVPPGVSPASFVAACADALNELRNADQLRQVRVQGPGAAAVQRLVQEET
ncbi:unnamed protein product [Durusdinium trenchii]|uniref:Uncharacterized protein n=1 Tax=Durusdinium trenchii TaxID=1381693 RepID=A0ABP0RV37_9DINO